MLCRHLTRLPLAWLVSAVKHRPLSLRVYRVEVRSRIGVDSQGIYLGRSIALPPSSRYTAERLANWTVQSGDRNSIEANFARLGHFALRERNSGLTPDLPIDQRRVAPTVGWQGGSERFNGLDEVLEARLVLTEHRPDVVYLIGSRGSIPAPNECKAAAFGVTNRAPVQRTSAKSKEGLMPSRTTASRRVGLKDPVRKLTRVGPKRCVHKISCGQWRTAKPIALHLVKILD